MIILSPSSFFLKYFLRSVVAQEITFYLAAVVLVVLTVESCIKLLNRDPLAAHFMVYVTVFGWYFVDPFINPEQYDYLPSSSVRPKLWAGIIVFNRIPRFHARCNALDCLPAEFGQF